MSPPAFRRGTAHEAVRRRKLKIQTALSGGSYGEPPECQHIPPRLFSRGSVLESGKGQPFSATGDVTLEASPATAERKEPCKLSE